jgi:protein-L-isoaspartate(D-aspartate) O-methyltransferase
MTPARALADAFAAVPRTGFLPEDQRRFADVDRALPIGWGQTNSQPTTVRTMLSLLDVQPGHRILDVGCGSAWSTALLAHLVGPDGAVIGVEIVPELIAFGRANLAALPMPNARIEPALPDVLGLPDEAPFDRVLVSAEASTLPLSLVDQLRVGGVMVVPVAGSMHQVLRTETGHEVVRHGSYAFVPLVGG